MLIHVRFLNRDYSSIPTLLDGDGTTTVESSSAKAACLNNFFFTCFNQNYPPLTEEVQDPDFTYGSLGPSNCPADLLCTEESILELLAGLDVSKSTGTDGISPRMMKSTSLSIAPSLCKLFNLSISTGTFPSAWKLGRITPISKRTNNSLPSGYRPISVLPVASKLIERHVKATVEHFLQVNAPISSSQWGFMSNRSTVSALIKVLDDWQRALDQGCEICVVFFDVSKAFDTVPHLPLLQTLSEIGLDPYLIRWIRSYLAGRSQFVSIDGCNSPTLPVLSGVPQGSVLGPLLFVSYINDVAAAVSSGSNVNMFADDIALYRVIKTRDDYVYLQEDVNSISTCIEQKYLQFNTTKCKLMFITRKRANSLPPPPLTLNGVVLNRVFCYKYLGVTLSSDLSWSPHIRNCCNKTRRLIGLLYRRFYRCTNSPSLLRLYKSFVRPHLEYAAIAWNPHLKGEIEAIENVQKFALRVCLKSWDSDYNELLRVSNLPPLHKRRAQLSLCHLYKITHNLCYFPPVFSARETRTHVNRPILLTQPFARSNSYFCSFVPRVISLWKVYQNL